MAKRREKLKLTQNDFVIGCPLCVGPTPPPSAAPRTQQQQQQQYGVRRRSDA